jgi:Protein of unknown function (DUF1566)
MNFEIAPKSTESQLTWDDARLYCFALNIDGKTGWRLPTKAELVEIFQSANDFRGFWYWSSTEYNGKNVWVQTFNNGFQSLLGKYDVSYVRAIRDLKDN